MPRPFFTPNSHVGHKSILSPRFDRPRPFSSIADHDEALVAAWNGETVHRMAAQALR